MTIKNIHVTTLEDGRHIEIVTKFNAFENEYESRAVFEDMTYFGYGDTVQNAKEDLLTKVS